MGEVMKKLPPYLLETLRSISNGEDIHFCLAYLGSNAGSYVSRLKTLGLAYTHIANGVTEVWRSRAGESLLENLSLTR